MKNRETWKPSKFVYHRGRLVASPDAREVGAASTLITNIIAELYARKLPLYASGRLLDLGCGKVPLYAAYKDYVTENICVDWENSLHLNDHIDRRADLGAVLPFDDAEFDTILLSDVLEHIADPELLWCEMVRLLAPGGRIILNVPFYYWIHEQPHDYYRYTEFALRRFTERAGVALIELESIAGAPEVIADVASKCMMRLPRIGASLARCTQWLGWSFVRTSFGAKVSRATRGQFPLGYFLVAEKPRYAA